MSEVEVVGRFRNRFISGNSKDRDELLKEYLVEIERNPGWLVLADDYRCVLIIRRNEVISLGVYDV